MDIDYLSVAWWLVAMILFITPMAIAESIERRRYARHTKRFYRI